MRITSDNTDATVLAELGHRLARYRLDRNQSQAELACRAGVSKRTVERVEAGETTKTSALLRVLRALDLLDALDRLVPEPGPSPIQLLDLRNRQRQRASSTAKAQPPAQPVTWAWGDEE